MKKRSAQSMKAKYHKYIKSKAWQKKKQEKLDCFPICMRCGAKEGLQVHHNNYNRFRNERLQDLDVLCKRCHRMVHQFKARY